MHVASWPASLFWWFLWCHFRDRIWIGDSGDCSQSIHGRYEGNTFSEILTSCLRLPVCGPPKYSELRINLAQAVQAVGTVIGPVLGSYAFFKSTSDSVTALKNVQWVYLAVAIFVFLLAGVFFIARIPEITDADMEFQVTETHAGSSDKPFRKQYRLFHAAAAQWCYTGAQGD